jgi:hypothetical protein
MSKKTRKTPIYYETSIIDGVLYFEDAAQAKIDTEQFTEIIDDKYTVSVRLVSLAGDWQTREWVSGVGSVAFSLKIEMTLRKELVKGQAYWYAYRRAGGKLQKRYVGASDRVTTKRIVEIAQKMV